MSNVIVIGGGPAGMMAAIRAAEAGASVRLLEKNPVLGKKLMLTGKGRCNVTNACGQADFIKRFGRNGDFLRDAFSAFFNRELMDFFRGYGVPLKIERQDRVFPESDRAASVLKVLQLVLRRNHVGVRLGTEVTGIVVSDGAVRGVKTAGAGVLEAEAVILATGGTSYPGTGSTGQGMIFAREAGHTVLDLYPALVGLRTRPAFPGLEGVSLRNIAVTFTHGRKKIQSGVGDLMFTRGGISGPLVISMSGMAGDWIRDGASVCVEVDLKPGLSDEDLDRRMIRDCQAEPSKKMKNFLKQFLPQRMVPVILGLAGVDPEKQAGVLIRKERAALCAVLKAMRLGIIGPDGFDTAMVTRGGVSVKEIDPRTMQSRLVRGLYFAGEMIDVDGDTGGFNLQAAFSTGYLAGQSCAGLLCSDGRGRTASGSVTDDRGQRQ